MSTWWLSPNRTAGEFFLWLVMEMIDDVDQVLLLLQTIRYANAGKSRCLHKVLTLWSRFPQTAVSLPFCPPALHCVVGRRRDPLLLLSPPNFFPLIFLPWMHAATVGLESPDAWTRCCTLFLFIIREILQKVESRALSASDSNSVFIWCTMMLACLL